MNDTELRTIEAAGTAAPWHVEGYWVVADWENDSTEEMICSDIMVSCNHRPSESQTNDIILAAAARNALPLHLAQLAVYSEAMDRIGCLTRSDADIAMNIAYDAMDEIDRIIKGEK